MRGTPALLTLPFAAGKRWKNRRMAMTELGEGLETRGLGWRPRGDALSTLPWALLAAAVVMALAGLAPFGPDRCDSVGLSRGATGWSGGDLSLWPPSSTCVLDFADGSTTSVVSSSWWLPLGTAVMLALMAVGFVRPPARQWRHAAWAGALLSAIGVLLVLWVFGALG